MRLEDFIFGALVFLFSLCVIAWVILWVWIRLCDREGERRWDEFHAKRMPIWRRKQQLLWRARGERTAGNEAESQMIMDEYDGLIEPTPKDFGVSYDDPNWRSTFPH